MDKMLTAVGHAHRNATTPFHNVSIWAFFSLNQSRIESWHWNLQLDHIHFNSVLKQQQQQQLQQQKALQYSTQPGLLLSSSVPSVLKVGSFLCLVAKEETCPRVAFNVWVETSAAFFSWKKSMFRKSPNTEHDGDGSTTKGKGALQKLEPIEDTLTLSADVTHSPPDFTPFSLSASEGIPQAHEWKNSSVCACVRVYMHA